MKTKPASMKCAQRINLRKALNLAIIYYIRSVDLNRLLPRALDKTKAQHNLQRDNQGFGIDPSINSPAEPSRRHYNPAASFPSKWIMRPFVYEGKMFADICE